MSIQYIRYVVNATVTLFTILIIVSRILSFSTIEYWLWGLPGLLIAVLDIYYLTKSTLRVPKNIDAAFSTVFISVSANFGFLFGAFVITYPVLEFSGQAVLRDIGKAIALAPYPFVIWALFCLKDCLTVIPEAHGVVARGIYKYSRHPLYMCYIIWAIANMLMFPSWQMIVVSSGHIILLVVRFQREENVLLATFPEYHDYYQRTGLAGNRGKLKGHAET